MINYSKKYNKYIEFINAALQNRNIDNEEHSWEATVPLHELIYPKSSLVMTNSTTLGIESSELLLLIRIKDKLLASEKLAEAIATEIKTNVKNYHNYNVINIIWILDSIDVKISLRYECSKVLSLVKSTLSYTPKFLSTYYVDKDICAPEIKLYNIKRPKMLLLPPLEPNVHIQESTDDTQKQYPSDLKGYMLTANLYDIVEVYNQVGDTLFKDNVRFGIGEQLGVDKAIKDTLKNAPQYFWFRNNGITLLIEEPDTILNSASEIVLKQQDEEKIKFSVINGAQTITAAAEYFYSMQAQIEQAKSKNDNKELALKLELENAKNAKVVLRIIQIQGKNIPEEARKISVALNRQKPIKMEDIAFTNYFVDKINSYLELNCIGYSLAKRSEISYSHNEYSLIDFARARKACSGAPGEARNKDAAAMLKISDKNETKAVQQFTDTAIFVEEWYESKDSESDKKVFDKYYSPVLFAIKVANIYENNYKNMVIHNSYYDTVIKNGKWYFVSFLVFVLNGNDTDYSGFNFKAEDLKREEIILLIGEFAKYYCDLFAENTPKINSNTFKKSDQYNKIKKSDYKNSKFYLLLSQIFKLPANSNSTISSLKRNPPTKVTTVKIFNNSIKVVSSAANAFSYTVSECLRYAYKRRINLDSFLINCPYISTTKINSGYFRTSESVIINNKLFYIGKSHSFETKVAHVNKLCTYLNLAADSICWMNGQDVVYKNP